MIIGHQQIIKQLQHAVDIDHIAGAYLFAGMSNVGKETVALYFAKSINCLDLVHRPCDNCLACHKINTSNILIFKLFVLMGSRLRLIRSVNCSGKLCFNLLKVDGNCTLLPKLIV